jgi:hypothetical protein
MTEEDKLNSAMARADDLMVASLRREEAARSRRMLVIWVAGSLVLGGMIGSGMTWWCMRQPVGKVVAQPTTRGNVETLTAVGAETRPMSGKCEVKWGGMWRNATIVKEESGCVLVTYDGTNSYEWVQPERIRAVGSMKDDIGYARPTPMGEKPTGPVSRKTENERMQ